MEHVYLVAIDEAGLPVERSIEPSEAAQDACRSCALLYELYGFEHPWIGYLLSAGDRHVGSCAFKGPPRDGMVEIAFYTFAGNENRGYATAMASALLDIAAGSQVPVRVMAFTQPEENAANAVLRKLGFRLDGLVQHPEDGPMWGWARLSTGPS